MDLFEAIYHRRSTRQFADAEVPDSIINKALSAAIWAPNSSNLQTWDFYWVKSTQVRLSLVDACLNQAPARKAKHLIVVTANPKLWKRSQPYIKDWVDQESAPKSVRMYYERLVPLTYTWGILNSLGIAKKIGVSITGLFRPIMRRPCTRQELQEVAIKSAALAAENFVLAITAQGYDTCMMEGFDESRVRALLGLGRNYRIAMIIAIGKAAEKATWGKPFRIPEELVIHRI